MAKPLLMTTASIHIEVGLDEDGDPAYTILADGEQVDNLVILGALSLAQAYIHDGLLGRGENEA